MSKQYPGGIISKTAPTPSGPYADSTAPGVWTLEQQAYWQKLGQWPTAGNVNPSAFIENLFSTWLYTGNGSTQTITNGIDLAGEGGLVWQKIRGPSAGAHILTDTARGVGNYIMTDSTDPQYSGSGAQAFNTNGFGSTPYGSGANIASWTFRKQPKFFDVVTWTGSNDSGTSIGQGIVPHNLGSAPGCVIIKNVTQGATNWIVYHRSLSGGYRMLLNTTDAQTNSGSAAYFSKYVSGVGWTQTDPDANNIYVGYNYQTNGNGDTLVAYVFAHNAGSFGLTGTDNVISCGSYTTDGNGLNSGVSLGYEPQWIMYKRTDSSSGGGWYMQDNMRGMTTDGAVQNLFANTSAAESSGTYLAPTATGFKVLFGQPSATYIYIAIRRGPMKVPTSGTSVFSPVTTTGTGTNSRVITGVGFSPDMIINCTRGATTLDRYTQDRLRGVTPTIYTNSTSAEQANQGIYAVGTLDMTGFTQGTSAGVGFNSASDTYVFYNFKRAPSFFDEVCYTGTGASSQVLTHNLTVTPQLTIFKKRSASNPWDVVYGNTSYLQLNDTLQAFPDTSIAATATTITAPLGAGNGLNASGATYVAYLFATCAGVSKVGSYTGTATTKQIDCGFTGGARWVMIKRTDSTGDWYVWDSTRGIVAGNDPYLLLNSSAAEVTNTDYVDTYSAGFEISSTAPAAINASGGTFIFLAIA